MKYTPVAFVLLTVSLFCQNPEWEVFTTDNSLMAADQVYSLAVDSTNAVWAGTPKGLMRIQNGNWSRTSPTGTAYCGTISSIVVDTNNHVWVTALGLNEYDQAIWKQHNPTLTGHLSIDSRNHLWGSAAGQDCLSKYDGQNLTVYSRTGKVTTVYVDGDDVAWYGAGELIGGKIGCYDGTNWNESSSSGTNILHGDEDGNVYTGWSDGVSAFLKGDWNNRVQNYYTKSNSGIPNNNVTAIHYDRFKHLWVGTTGGIAIYDGITWETFTTGNSPLPVDRIDAIVTDLWGNTWIGTESGLAVYRKGGVILSYDHPGIVDPDITITAYPNPFSSTVDIRFDGPFVTPELVEFEIYNLLGEKVANLKSDTHSKVVRWNGITPDGNTLPTGLYIVRLLLQKRNVWKTVQLIR